MSKMVDVAKLANVSTATVSRVLSKNENVSEETRLRVLEAINTLKYKPNRLASNFRKMSSKTVLVILPDVTNPFFAKILQGFKDVALKHDYHLLLGDTGNSLKQERDFIELVKEKLVDGLILATARIPREEIVTISKQIPVVLACEYIEGEDIPIVSIDNVTAAREATEHLVKLGHRRIGHITGPLSVILGRDRVKGYRQALLLNDIAIEESLIQEGDFTVKSGYENMVKLLSVDDPPTAVFAASDEMAIGAMKAIKRAGLKIPDDISVIGFDDIPLCSIVEPELSTVSQPQYEIGVKAMQMLLHMLDNQHLDRNKLVLPHKLTIRHTCNERS